MLDQAEAPGVTVSVVHDGELLTSRGYGSSDRATRLHDCATPVDPERHLFRIGSVSKLFTAVSAMPLVGEGQLGLDADVQKYLDFDSTHPGARRPPATSSHTGGFEEYMGEGFIVPTPEQMKPLGEAVQDQPDQIYEPDTVTAYSNFGTALLGRLVEIISGQSYADYVDQHILQPLDMTHSSAAQPLPADLQPDMVSGFTTFAGTEPAPFEHISSAPVRSISATSVDMARFMNFALGHEPRILKRETLQVMQMHASADADGTLTLAGMKLREASPSVWQQFEGRDPMGGAIHRVTARSLSSRRIRC